MKVFSKTCRTCQFSAKKNVTVEHECVKNYVGSSKGMETEAIFRLCIEYWEGKNIGIGIVVSDDDSTMRAHLTHLHKENNEAGIVEKTA